MTETTKITGIVKFFGLDYGFIQPDDPNSDDVYIHFSNIEPWRKGHKNLVMGQSVKFSLTKNDKGLEAMELEIHPDDRGMSKYEFEESKGNRVWEPNDKNQIENKEDNKKKLPEQRKRLPKSKFQTLK